MLEKLVIPGIPLPRLYVAHTYQDANDAMEAGIPFVRWRKTNDELVKALLRPVLEKMFPYIKWNQQFTSKFKTNVIEVEGTHLDEEPPGVTIDEGDNAYPNEDGTLSETADIATEERLFKGRGIEATGEKLSLENYIGDISSHVNIETLQTLKLMPAFIGDITDCIKLNLSERLYWTEGYNKKRRAALGNFNASSQLPNLIILDVSGSIPRGISATMIQLIDTLRTETYSDLIITASISRWYPNGCELPSPQEIRDAFGYGNESEDFVDILNKNVVGRKWGHVISFGDYDTPYTYGDADMDAVKWAGTHVNKVHHYHTTRKDRTGYAKWCSEFCDAEEEFDTSWCEIIKN